MLILQRNAHEAPLIRVLATVGEIVRNSLKIFVKNQKHSTIKGIVWNFFGTFIDWNFKGYFVTLRFAHVGPALVLETEVLQLDKPNYLGKPIQKCELKFIKITEKNLTQTQFFESFVNFSADLRENEQYSAEARVGRGTSGCNRMEIGILRNFLKLDIKG